MCQQSGIGMQGNECSGGEKGLDSFSEILHFKVGKNKKLGAQL